jgi:HEAT repeat protein
MGEVNRVIELKELRWTTRAEVCAQLWQYLLATWPVPGDVPDAKPETGSDGRDRVAELFATIADGTWIPSFKRLLLNRHETYRVRKDAREALRRLRATLSADEIADLLTDPPTSEPPDAFEFVEGLLHLLSDDEAQSVAITCLEQWAPLERAQLLAGVGLELHHLPPELADWVYYRWLEVERPLVADAEYGDEPINLWIADMTERSRPESLRLHLEYWRQAEGEERQDMMDGFGDFSNGVPAEWLADNPEELREFAEALRLTVADLIAYFGAEPLMARLEAGFRAISRTRQADPSDWSVIHDGDFKRMCHLIATWPDADRLPRIRSLFGCPDIETEVRWELCYCLWHDERAEVLTMVQGAAELTGDLELAERVLRRIADAPLPADRHFLRWGAWHEERSRLPYFALQGLEALGEESPEWTVRLETLAGSEDPFLRLQATAALASRGDETRLPEVVREATGALDPCVRGEAIRALGQLRRPGYLPIFQNALWQEQPGYVPPPDPDDEVEDGPSLQPMPCFPAAEEAGLAISRLGTPEALTELVCGFIYMPNIEARWRLIDHLEEHISRLDGRECRDYNIMSHFGWRPEFFGRMP